MYLKCVMYYVIFKEKKIFKPTFGGIEEIQAQTVEQFVHYHTSKVAFILMLLFLTSGCIFNLVSLSLDYNFQISQSLQK